jgi:hypothetical protein
MRRFPYALLCLLCGLAGAALGRFVWVDAESPGRRVPSAVQPPNTSPKGGGKTLGRVRSGPRFTALALAMAARGETGRLAELIEACAHDPEALEQLAAIWSQTDPAAFALALAHSKAIKGSGREECHMVLTGMMSRWARQQPDDAWNAAEKFPPQLRRFMLSQVALDRVAKDPKEGLEFILRHPGIVPAGPTQSLDGRRDLVPLLQQLPDGFARFQCLKSALKGVPIAEALAAVPHSVEESNTYARRALLSEAAKAAVDDVIAFHQQAAGADRYAAAQVVGQVLVTKDPAAAVEWSRANLSGDMRNAIIRKAAENLQSKNPAAAEAARALLPESFRQSGEK